MQNIFSTIYMNNSWGDSESISGFGSRLDTTIAIRRELPKLIKDFYIKDMLDVPCGDFNWMKEVNLDLGNYIGGDIVQDLVDKNKKMHEKDNKAFLYLDITKSPLPRADLIICRDCLVHFSFENIQLAINQIKLSKSHYLLTTTFVNRTKNQQITTGEWRPINLNLPPFNFPPPIKIINEEFTFYGKDYSDKSLGLWEINTLP